MRRGLPLLASLLGLGAVIAVFAGLGSGGLASPPLHPSGWQRWADARDGFLLVFALLRLLVLALAWYALVVTVVGGLARLTDTITVVRLTDALTLPILRRVIQGAMGISVATTMLVSPGTASARPETPGLTRPSAAATADARSTDEGLAPKGGLTTAGAITDRHTAGIGDGRRPPALQLAGSAEPEEVPTTGAGHDQADEHADGASSPRRSVTSHDVRPGESLWSIARDALAQVTPRNAPTDAEVADYWREVIERNRSEFVDPANPDLIFPGQTVGLPEPSTTK